MAATKLVDRPQVHSAEGDDLVLRRIAHIDQLLLTSQEGITDVDRMSSEVMWSYARRAAVLVCANQDLALPSEDHPHEFGLRCYFTIAVTQATKQSNPTFNARLHSVLLQRGVFRPIPRPRQGVGSLRLTPPLMRLLDDIQ